MDNEVPSAELKIGETAYQLCFTFGAIQEAKRILRKEGIRINLLLALDALDVDVDTLPALLYGALRLHHPEIDYKAVTAMLDVGSAHRAFAAICEAYAKSAMGTDAVVEQTADPQPGPKE